MATPISPTVQDSLQTLDARVELNLLEVLAKSYGEGFVKAVEGMEAKPQIKKDDSRLLKEDVARLTKPIQDYNKALAGKVDEIVRDSFAAGKDDMEVARILRARIPEILNNEPITIQRIGKRPVSFTADEYADIVANVVPYAVRNEGYIRGLKEAGADGWQWVAVGDERMCPMCGAKHGQIYGWDDAKPPGHPGCRCRPIAYFRKRTKEEIAESERIKAKALEKPWGEPSLAELPIKGNVPEIVPGVVPLASNSGGDLPAFVPKQTKDEVVQEIEGLMKAGKGDNYPVYPKMRVVGNDDLLKGPEVTLKDLDPDILNKIGKNLEEIDSDLEKYGVPRYRGLHDMDKLKERPAMGRPLGATADGMMFLDKQNVEAVMSQTKDSILDDLQKQADKLAAKAAKEDMPFLKQVTEFEKSKIDEKIAKIKAGDLSDYVSGWKKGLDPYDRPDTIGAYFVGDDSLKASMWHETGHQVTDWYGVNGDPNLVITGDGEPPLAKKVYDLYNAEKAGKSGAIFPTSPTKYAEQNWADWWAESFAAHKMGRDDLVDDLLLPILKDLDGTDITKLASIAKPATNPEEIAEALIDDILPKKMAYPGSKIERPKLERKVIGIDESEVVDKYVTKYMSGDPSVFSKIDNQDMFLSDIVKSNEFDGLPKLVSPDELDKIVAEGHRELWRGVSQKDFADKFKSGEYFAGTGIYGDGTYTAYGPRQIDIVSGYAGSEDGCIIRMAIDKDAKIITIDDLKREMSDYLNELSAESAKKLSAIPKGDKDLYLRFSAENSVKMIVANDPGKFAALKGYDAIDIPSENYMVVINRKALYVHKESISIEQLNALKSIERIESNISDMNKRIKELELDKSTKATTKIEVLKDMQSDSRKEISELRKKLW